MSEAAEKKKLEMFYAYVHWHPGRDELLDGHVTNDFMIDVFTTLDQARLAQLRDGTRIVKVRIEPVSFSEEEKNK